MSTAVAPHAVDRSRMELDIGVMTCASCASCAPPGTDPAALAPRVQTAGDTARLPAPAVTGPGGQAPEEPDPTRALRERLTVSAVLAVPVVVLAAVPALRFGHWQWISLTLAAPVVVWGAWPSHRAAWTGLRQGAATTDTLVSLGTLAALGWSLYALLFGAAGVPGGIAPADRAGPVHLALAAGVAVIVLAGRQVEAGARRRAGAALRALPEPGAPGTVPPSTGAPAPAGARSGAAVAGGRPVVRATSRLGADAPHSGTAAARLAGRVPGVFVPLVIALAVGTLGFWFGSGAGAAAAFPTAVTVLIVACAGAPGLASPTAVLAGAGRGAELGILVTGPEVLESARRVDTVVLDGTGTLRTGTMRVREVGVAAGVPADYALRLAGAVTQESEHPVGRAIARAAAQACAGALPGVADFDAHPGLGVRGVVAEVHGDCVVAHAVLVGRPALLAEHDIALPADLVAARADAEAAGRTAVAVAWDGRARALIVVDDPVQPAGTDAVRRLRRLGLTPILLTGDDAVPARAVAARVGIAPGAVIAEARPADKVGVVRRLQGDGKVVAMVGDGVNDGAALATADLSLALDAGAGVPGEAGDPAPVRGDLLAAVDAIRLSRRTLGVIRGNDFCAFAYNLAALPPAAAGLLDPMLAGVTMALGSMFVTANSLRPGRFRAAP